MPIDSHSEMEMPLFTIEPASISEKGYQAIEHIPRNLFTNDGEPVSVSTNQGNVFSILGAYRGVAAGNVRVSPDSSEIENISKAISSVVPPNPDVMVWVTVPKVWTQGSGISVKFDVFNDGFTTASLYLNFYTYDPGTELHLSMHVSVPRASFRTYYLIGTVPSTTAGLKGAAAAVTGSTTIQWDWGYEYVQIFGNGDFQFNPSDDDMADESSNPRHYFEGISGDGWSINPSNALWHCTDWSIRFKAAIWADGCTTPNSCGREIAEGVTSFIIYTDSGDYHSYTVEDRRVFAERKGVCDEKALLMVSMWRAMGLPGSLIEASDGGANTHAWGEVWDGFEWVHADPTILGNFGILIWDNPTIYCSSWLLPDWQYVQIQSYGNDFLYHGEGSDTDGNLQYYWDFGYICGYDGNNQYCSTLPPYDTFNDPYG